MSEVVCVLEARAELGEGTFWDSVAKVLWWDDIWGKALHLFEPISGKDERFAAPDYVGSLAPRERGGLVIALHKGFYAFDPAMGFFETIVEPSDRQPLTRFNDGKTDRQGRFWSGTVFEDPPHPTEFVGALYRLDPDLSCHRMVEGIGSSNGLAFSPDGRTLYFADSQGGFVWAFDLDPATGDIYNRRVYIDFRQMGGSADGATVDAEGCYWSTLPESGKVCRFEPPGTAHANHHTAHQHPYVLRVRRSQSRPPLRDHRAAPEAD
jgi:sugar lactone lactonase YvrE